ncbi:putative RDD family membrane protein YckC [Spinactinospora alkalitolerans]|uniref:Putative RDD family membrane protein YckC n=1 Tax=Spinactinospora alkalitolerans TaxID=687207 RepID=A0A852U416_9ACTN|nr:RDD family protein [Spinactinospora alkalitolerans]NYE49653.1 putative RDD family membrane protein YckC [Spinactinospora alkalitolerans]
MAHPGGGHYGQSHLITGDAVVLDLRPAGFATRMLALLIDVAVQVALLFGATVLVAAVGAGLDAAATAAVQVALVALLIVGYPTTFEALTRGRSLGKLALGLRVVGTDGSPERFRQALARALSAFVEIWLLSGVPALITSLVNRDGRRIGDFLAGTLVVEERAGRRRDEVIAMPPRLAEWARSAELSGLTPDAAAMARQYVLRFGELTEQARYEMGVRVADTVARAVSPPPPPGTSPPEFLSAVLAERRRREEERMARRQDHQKRP